MTELSSSVSPRAAIADLLRRRLTEAHQVVKGGAMDGVAVVSLATIEEVFAEPLPPPSENAAEITTPGIVTVAALCPECGIATDIVLTVGSELRTDTDGSEIHLKGKSKARGHVHGQQRLADALWDIGDVTGKSDGDDPIQSDPTP